MLKCSFFTVLCSIFKDAETGKSSLFLFYKIDVFFIIYVYLSDIQTGQYICDKCLSLV